MHSEQALRLLKKKAGNESCADCGDTQPRWCSINTGVVICLDCSGNHRALGPLVSRIRSMDLDTWSSHDLHIMLAIGNSLANDYYEYRMPKAYPRPVRGASQQLWLRFHTDKYKHLLFTPKGHFPSPYQEYISSLSQDQHSTPNKLPSPNHPPNKLQDISRQTEPTPRKEEDKEWSDWRECMEQFNQQPTKREDTPTKPATPHTKGSDLKQPSALPYDFFNQKWDWNYDAQMQEISRKGEKRT